MSTSLPEPTEVPADATPDPLFTAHIDPVVVQALETFAEHDEILVALDFDGTLAPIVLHPPDARMTPASMDAVIALAQAPGVHLAIVSGRSTSDLTTVTWLPEGTHVIGSHGAQMGIVRTVDGPEGQVQRLEASGISLSAEQAALLEEVGRRLHVIAERFPGAKVEHKPTTAVLHTRECAEADAERATQEALDGPGALEGVRSIVGKEVVEMSTLDVNKGDGMILLRERTGAAAAMYIGDDTTDEDAFAVLPEPNLTIKVGEGETRAQYRVASPDEVSVVLHELVRQRQEYRDEEGWRLDRPASD